MNAFDKRGNLVHLFMTISINAFFKYYDLNLIRLNEIY